MAAKPAHCPSGSTGGEFIIICLWWAHIHSWHWGEDLPSGIAGAKLASLLLHQLDNPYLSSGPKEQAGSRSKRKD